MSKKPAVNVKEPFGDAKWGKFSSVSPAVLSEIGAGMHEGNVKYSPYNWRREPKIKVSTYYDSCLRHLFAFMEGEDIDPDSQLSHVTKAICSLIVLRDAQIADLVDDDRPPQTNFKKVQENLKGVVERIHKENAK